MSFYSEALDAANEALAEFGFAVTLVKNQTQNALPNKPWKKDGSLNQSEVTQLVNAIRCSIGDLKGFGFEVDASGQSKEALGYYIIAPGTSGNKEVLDSFNIVRNGSLNYPVSKWYKFQPTTVTLLYVAEVKI